MWALAESISDVDVRAQVMNATEGDGRCSPTLKLGAQNAAVIPAHRFGFEHQLAGLGQYSETQSHPRRPPPSVPPRAVLQDYSVVD
jgi:hypothetical protein